MSNLSLNLLRTNKNAGAVCLVFGILVASFAICALLMVVLQRAMMSTFPPSATADSRRLFDGMTALHDLWFVNMPWLIVGGIVYAVSGVFILRGSNTARRIAQLNSLAGYLWLISYMYGGFHVSRVFPMPGELVGENIGLTFRLISSAWGFMFGACFPSVMLFITSRPRAAQIAA